MRFDTSTLRQHEKRHSESPAIPLEAPGGGHLEMVEGVVHNPSAAREGRWAQARLKPSRQDIIRVPAKRDRSDLEFSAPIFSRLGGADNDADGDEE